MNIIKLLPRFREAYRMLSTLEARENWSREEIQQFQLERLNQSWAHARNHVPYYRQLATELHLPKKFTTLAEFQHLMPPLSKDTLRSDPTSFLSRQRQRGSWHWTSGSTGMPLGLYWGNQSRLEVLRAKYRFYASWGVDIFDRFAYLWGDNQAPTSWWSGFCSSLWQRISDRLRNRVRLPSYQLCKATLSAYLDRLSKTRAVALYGLSSAIHLLAKEVIESSKGCEGLRMVCLTGEPALPPMLHTVRQAFPNASTVVEYGATECELIAGTAQDGLLRAREDLVHVETVANNQGQYDILLTVLCNPSAPLFRYVIGDTTEEPMTIPPQGFGSLSPICGRSDDILISRTGTMIHPTRVDLLFEGGLRSKVRRYQAHQTEDGSLELRLELESHATIDISSLQQNLSDILDGFRVHITVVENLPSTGAGKHRAIRSELANSS